MVENDTPATGDRVRCHTPVCTEPPMLVGFDAHETDVNDTILFWCNEHCPVCTEEPPGTPSDGCPVEVDAIQWTGDNYYEVGAFTGEFFIDHDQNRSEILIYVTKSGAYATVERGGWVIREPDGVGVRPCTEEHFADTYTASNQGTLQPSRVLEHPESLEVHT